MNYIILFLVYILFFVPAFAASQAPGKRQPNVSDLYFSALQGNVNTILSTLDTIPDKDLNKDQLAFKNKYYHRFKTQDEAYDFKTNDTLLIRIMNIYQGYWKNVLLKKVELNTADSLFTHELAGYIWQVHYKAKGISLDSVRSDVTLYTKKLLNELGFHVANGKTASYFDLFIWGKEQRVRYKVRLPETRTKVSVVFLEGIITMGWEEYATFGTYFPGGWAAKDELYCVKSTYDLESENFKISYLRHEGQHFADYPKYPNLSGADLEYRAKLVELIYSRQSIQSLITFFIKNAAHENRSNSHSFANYCVIRDLSQSIFKQDWVADPDRWKQIPTDTINAQSRKLFKQNSNGLKEAGSNVVEYVN